MPLDRHSHAEPERCRVRHVALDLDLDIAARVVHGSVELTLERPDPTAPLVLDARGLMIEKVSVGGAPREHELGHEAAVLGSALSIELEPGDEIVRVDYRTTEAAAALQWLDPQQTAGGKHPYLFTQGQAILTRTWIPLQDSPGVRVTFEARIRAPRELTVVMAAERLGEEEDDGHRIHRFHLQHPIPAYLIALACGELEFLPISERCGVWAEPGLVGPARDELKDTEAMIATAEASFGSYRWGRFDLLILPPSFPYGGMENPMLTFATPTILAGDGSLVSLVAHELAHSWSGNLVTNATWRDFWLNEGFTVYLEQRIMEEVYGEDRATLEKALALEELERALEDLKPWGQVLHIDLEGRTPDAGATLVPYEKGALFLRRIEQIVGREPFDRFLSGYFDAHAFQSITTAQFVTYLKSELLDHHPGWERAIDLDEWLNQPGLPESILRPRSVMLQRVDEALIKWREGASPDDLMTADWVTQQWLHFIEALRREEDAAIVRMADLDAAFAFTSSKNSEILAAWLELAIRNGYTAADSRLEAFLMEVGRYKFLKPIYTELCRTDAGKERAQGIYAQARPRYHAVSTSVIDKIVG